MTKKDETEIGITGLPIPKKQMSAKNRYEFEKKRRQNIGTNVGGVTFKSDVNPGYNPRIKEEFDVWVEELWNEGYDLSNWTWEGLFEYYLDERRYDKDEPLPGSGKTPSQKMERKRGQHAARVMLGNPALGRHPRNDPERDSYRNRASMMDRVKDAQDKGEEPRDDEGRKNLIKAARRPRASYERQDNRPGGLRAGKTKAGGYRKLTRKEEFDAIVEYLFVEGYVDTIESAEVMVENISEQWANEILDEKHVKAMDPKGADRRASDLGGVPKRRKPTPDKYKHSEGDFSPRDLSPGARKRRDERRQGVGGFNEAKVDSHLNADNPEQRLRDRNERNVDPAIPVGYRTASRRSRHELSRGKKQPKGQKTNYDNLGNMNRSRYRQQQFKRTGNDLYKE